MWWKLSVNNSEFTISTSTHATRDKSARKTAALLSMWIVCEKVSASIPAVVPGHSEGFASLWNPSLKLLFLLLSSSSNSTHCGGTPIKQIDDPSNGSIATSAPTEISSNFQIRYVLNIQSVSLPVRLQLLQLHNISIQLPWHFSTTNYRLQPYKIRS